MVRTQNKSRATEDKPSLLHHQSDSPDLYLAHQWAEPRSIGTRYAAAVADLSPPQRSRLLADLAAATTHWAVPAAERNHLLVTMHHGHLQGANKCEVWSMFRGVITSQRSRRTVKTQKNYILP